MRIAAVLLLSLATACGGGGGGSPPPPPPPSIIIPTLAVTLTPASRNITVAEDIQGDLIFDAMVSGTSPLPISPIVQFNASQVTLLGIGGITGGYRVTLKTLPGLIGVNTGQATFRLCTEDACNTVYPGSTATFSYTYTSELGDWGNSQRGPTHTGYAPIVVDWSRMEQLWEWTAPTHARLFGVTTTPGLVHVTTNEASNGDYNVKTYTLRTNDGSLSWSYDFGAYSSIGAPASAGDRIYITTHQDSPDGSVPSHLWAFDRTGPTVGFKYPIQSLGGYERHRPSPTPAGDRIYLVAGWDEGRLMSIDAAAGTLDWSSAFGTPMSTSQSAAVDATRVYAYDGRGLRVHDRTSGALLFTIADPLASAGPVGPSYSGSVVVGGMNDVLALTGPASGGSFGLDWGDWGRRLVSYDLTTRAVRWTSLNSYKGPPVVANGMIYVADNDRRMVDALDQQTGAVRWSWPVPGAAPGSILMGSMIVTRNGLFLSTANSIYGIDLNTHQTAWTHNSAGMMSISRDGHLHVITAGTDFISRVLISNGKLRAFRLR